MKRTLIFAFILFLSMADISSALAQRYMTWSVSVSLRYNKGFYEKQDMESKLYGVIMGEIQNREILVSARNQDEAEKLGSEAALKVGGDMKASYEGMGELDGKSCHIFVFAEIESVTVETNPIDPSGAVDL